MEVVATNLKEMNSKQPIKNPSDDLQQGYNSGYYEATTELALRIGISLPGEDMNAITKESLNIYLRLKDNIENRISEVVHTQGSIETGKPYKGYLHEIEFEESIVRVAIKLDRDSSPSSEEYDYRSFPKAHLFNDYWIEPLKEQVQKSRELAEQKRINKEQLQMTELEKNERAELNRLKEKYNE
jgi:hypothetical protein